MPDEKRDELVERLRKVEGIGIAWLPVINRESVAVTCRKAADRIEADAKRIRELEAVAVPKSSSVTLDAVRVGACGASLGSGGMSGHFLAPREPAAGDALARKPPYPEFCRHPDKCAGRSSCPRDPCCCD
jgi:hypothetical protein